MGADLAIEEEASTVIGSPSPTSTPTTCPTSAAAAANCPKCGKAEAAHNELHFAKPATTKALRAH